MFTLQISKFTLSLGIFPYRKQRQRAGLASLKVALFTTDFVRDLLLASTHPRPSPHRLAKGDTVPVSDTRIFPANSTQGFHKDRKGALEGFDLCIMTTKRSFLSLEEVVTFCL